MGKIILITLVGMFLLFGFFYFYYQAAVNRQNYDGQGLVDFVVSPGQKVYEIAENLREARLINSAASFKIYVRINGLGPKLQAGYYRLPRDLSVKEIVDILQRGKFDLKLTFPEGWRREEMAYYAAQKLNRGEEFYRDFLKESEGFEGSLFPETYIVPKEISARELVKIMGDLSEKKYREAIQGSEALRLTQREVVILASIVEREVKKDEDRPVVAGIFSKRLKSLWALEADATVQYAVASRKLGSVPYSLLKNFEFWPKLITFDDLRIDSPYNSRRRQGLPPGPISNPGLASLKAVVKPVETPYWYYLNDSQGLTRFSKTLQEHNRNVERFLRP